LFFFKQNFYPKIICQNLEYLKDLQKYEVNWIKDNHVSVHSHETCKENSDSSFLTV